MDYGKIAGIDKPVSRIVFGTDRLRGRVCRGCLIEALSNRPSRFWIGHSSSDATRSTLRGSIGTANGRWGLGFGHAATATRSWSSARDVIPTSYLRRPRLSASDVSHDLHASLKALGTDFIDLYLLHYDHPTARVEPIIERLNRHMDEGKISAIGASNWSHERIASAKTVCRQQGPKTIQRVKRSIQPC